jgi:hypothetical protein
MSLLISTNTFAWNLFGPRDYAECISENLKDISSNAAARIIGRVCKNKFNEGNKDDKLNECVLKSMKGVTSDTAARIINRVCRDKFKKIEEPKVEMYEIPLANGDILHVPIGMSKQDALASAREQGVDAVGLKEIPLANGDILHAPENLTDEEAIKQASEAHPDMDFTLAKKK